MIQETLPKKSISEESASPVGKMEGILKAVLGETKLGEVRTYSCQLEDPGKQERQLRCLFAFPKENTCGKRGLGCHELGRSFRQTSAFTRKHRGPGAERLRKWNGSRKNSKRQRTFVEKKPFHCTDCGKAFIYHSDSILHHRIHTGEKPYVCNKCDKTFTQSSSLMEHQRIHTGEKRYQCKEYGKAFTQSSSLIKHQRCHTGEKPYKCNQCGKFYSQVSHLICHQKIHIGEKPYGFHGQGSHREVQLKVFHSLTDVSVASKRKPQLKFPKY